MLPTTCKVTVLPLASSSPAPAWRAVADSWSERATLKPALFNRAAARS